MSDELPLQFPTLEDKVAEKVLNDPKSKRKLAQKECIRELEEIQRNSWITANSGTLLDVRGRRPKLTQWLLKWIETFHRKKLTSFLVSRGIFTQDEAVRFYNCLKEAKEVEAGDEDSED